MESDFFVGFVASRSFFRPCSVRQGLESFERDPYAIFVSFAGRSAISGNRVLARFDMFIHRKLRVIQYVFSSLNSECSSVLLFREHS